MQNDKEKRTGVISKLKNYFITGMLIIAPTIVTLWVLKQIFLIFDGVLGRLYSRYVFGPFNLTTPTGLGAITLAVIIVLVGWSARFYVGKKLFEIWDKAINFVPLINRIYIAIRQLADTLKEGSGIVFQTPVLVQFPRHGLYSVGFITRECKSCFFDKIGNDIVSVFIPTTPNPTTGFIMYVSQDELIPLNISIEDAMKLIISAGTVVPDNKTSWFREVQ